MYCSKNLILKVFPDANPFYADVFAKVVTNIGSQFGIVNANSLAMFIAQCGAETHFKYFEEGGHLGKKGAKAHQATLKYRPFFGRGFIQLTGKENYKEFSMWLYGDDRILRNPDIVSRVEFATLASLWFWGRSYAKKRIYRSAIKGDVYETSLAVNGYTEKKINGKVVKIPNGLTHRQKYFPLVLNTIKKWRITVPTRNGFRKEVGLYAYIEDRYRNEFATNRV